MVLTKEQKEQVAMQLEKHNRDDVKSKITLDSNKEFELIVERGVFGSDIMSSGIYLAKFLYIHKSLYSNKVCLDMGCGPGIQGLIMAKYGAKHVDLSDINSKAVENTKKNIKLHNLKKMASAYVSDLFAGLPKNKKYEVIVFNHPFFPKEANELLGAYFQEWHERRADKGVHCKLLYYVATILFGDRPLCFLIKNKKIAESYLSYFELLWRISKK